jgi:pyruvate/2-oxoglutarate dehydrogenase complex dihydrolipoamide acyltransferase (E2) component
MLQPFTLVSTNEGTIGSILTEGSAVRAGALLARLTKQGDEMQEIRAPVPGIISKVLLGEGAKVKAGDTLLVLSPDAESVWESLRGLLLVGQVEDLPLIEKYADGEARMPLKVKEQAVQTALAIKDRSKNSSAPAPSG